MKREKKKKVRKHRLLNRPLLGTILLVLWGLFILTSIGNGLDMVAQTHNPEYLGGGWTALAGFLGLAVHRLHFRKEYKGTLQFRNFRKGMLLILPAFVFVITNLFEADFSGMTPKLLGLAFLAGMGPGVIEEVSFRALPISNLMRIWHDEKKVVTAATFTALLFGLIHITNIIAGAGVAVSLVQAVYAFGTGVLLAAVYLRTANLWPCLIMHVLVDFTAFLSPELAETGGVLTDNGFELAMLIPLAIGMVFAVFGYYYLRPSKRGEVLEVWSTRWKHPEEEVIPEEEAISEPEELPAAEEAPSEQ